MAVDIIARGLAMKKSPVFIFVENYDALPLEPLSNQMYYCMSSQGTMWLPGNWGGTYYPAGPYMFNGTSWDYVESLIAATQEEVDAGTENYKFVSPRTFQNSIQLYNLAQSIEAKNEELELQFPWKTGYDLYQEIVFTGENITQINYWIDNLKITKLYTKDITYDIDDNPTIITIKDEISLKILTTIFTYDNGEVVNITKTLI